MAVERQDIKRLDYLRLASDHMLVKVPGLSSYLRAEGSKLALKKDPTTLDTDNPMCRACGNVLIPGWSCGSRSLSGSKRSLSSEHKSDMRLLHCDRCGSTSRIRKLRTDQLKRSRASIKSSKPYPALKSENKHEPKSDHTASKESHEHISATGTSQDTKKPVASSNTRRARNKKAGLQAMLAKSKADAPGGGTKGLGLDLDDFLKG